MEIFLILIPGLATFLLLLGIFKVFFEQKIQAREHIQLALAPYKTQEIAEDSRRKKSKLLKIKTGKETPEFLKLELQLERANLLITPAEFIVFSLVAAFAGLLLVLVMTGNMLFAMLACALGYLGPFLFLHLKIWFRKRKAEEQFPNVLDAMVNCFKTGYGFSRAVQVVADNFNDPWGTEFGKMSVEMNLGNPLSDVLANLKNRMPTVDVELFTASILMQKETGGNLAEILAILANTCRERFKLFRKIAALTAQGKLSAGIVSSVPLLILLIMNWAMHESVSAFLTNPIGIILMSIAGIWMLVGVGILFKLVQLEV